MSLQGNLPDTVVGRVYVDDPDDWDLPDKTFRWSGDAPRNFRLDSNTGDITILQGTANGTYPLKFTVTAHYTHNVAAQSTGHLIAYFKPVKNILSCFAVFRYHLIVTQPSWIE